MEIKEATVNDVNTIFYIETTCFNRAEAASYDALKSRLEIYCQGFDILYENNQAIGYMGGLKNNVSELSDEMYHNSSLHIQSGRYQMIFSVCILPEYQGKGYARRMIENYIDKRKDNVDGFVLTCKDHLIGFYQSCGFEFEKVSNSTHGNTKWNDMVLKV